MFNRFIKYVFSIEFFLWILAFVALICYFSWVHNQSPFSGVNEMEFHGVQNHLVWDVKGKCFFAKPVTVDNVRLVQVPDCDKEINLTKDKK